jgi:excisionase family DNA binding protein|tara:strand:+ start:298 stop:492 length:195 start_codon:yes stop_codon:yes gene_type:complete
MEMEMLLTSSELGKQIGIAKNTILRMANAGKIPAFKLDNDRGDFRFDLEEVKAALRANVDSGDK